jgi:HAD superfamily hydrolase (TIGR01509 family)
VSLQFLGREIAGVIFDMDGVLVDSEPLHHEAVNQILADEGASIDEEFYKQYIGTTLEFTWTDLKRQCSLRRPYSYYARRYDEVILEIYRLRSMPTPGARELLDALVDRPVKLALASSSHRSWVDTCLEALSFTPYFQVSVTGDEVTKGKPDPEIYLATVDKLGLAPGQCLVIEDAPHGVLAAKSAGVLAVAVDTEYTRDLEIPDADLRLHDLLEVRDALLGARVEAV